MKESHSFDLEKEMKKGELTKIIANLKGSSAMKVTKLGKKYNELLNNLDKLNKLKSEYIEELTLVEKEIFKEENDYVTRVLKTGKLTVTFAKQSEKVTNVEDYESAFKALMDLYPELKEKGEELLATYTTAKVTITKTKLSKVTLDEGIVSDFYKGLKSLISSFVSNFKVWIKTFDRKMKVAESLVYAL
jgi:hypothetical protein